MVKLSVTEKYRAETREEAEDFIRAQRENGAKDGYDITEAKYIHKDRKKLKKSQILVKLLLLPKFIVMFGLRNNETY